MARAGGLPPPLTIPSGPRGVRWTRPFKQLLSASTREPLPMRPGTVERFDYVYTRKPGLRACLLLPANPSRAGRHPPVTGPRLPSSDWALFLGPARCWRDKLPGGGEAGAW